MQARSWFEWRTPNSVFNRPPSAHEMGAPLKPEVGLGGVLLTLSSTPLPKSLSQEADHKLAGQSLSHKKERGLLKPAVGLSGVLGPSLSSPNPPHQSNPPSFQIT